jgi:antiviral helicase SLH1
MWPFNHPLGQFDLSADLMYNIERWADDLSVNEISAMSDAEFGTLVHQNERLGGVAIKAAKAMPSLSISHSLQPLTHDLLRVRLQLGRQFDWSEKYHGGAEAFWVWIEDEQNLAILQMTRVLVRPSTTIIYHDFVVPITSTIPSSLHIRVVSDRWMGAEDVHTIPLNDLVMPLPPPPHLPLLDLPLLSSEDAFAQSTLRDLYTKETPTFDPVQTQCFHSLYHTPHNSLICSPSASTRGTLLELAIW